MNNLSKYQNVNHKSDMIITEESLAIMTDEELKKAFLSIRSCIYKSRRSSKVSSRTKEIDLCYIQREMQLRKNARSKNKSTYVQK
jgi:hypothetical protein